MSRKLLAEGLGTFALLFFGTGAIVVGNQFGVPDHLGVSIAFGLVIMVMIYAVGDISGAHFNPAVTLGFYLCKRFPAKSILPYISAQIIGGSIASALLFLMFSENSDLGSTHPSGPIAQSFIIEVVMTFFLMYVILCVATGSKEKGMTAAMAIGGIVGLEALVGGPISGASMNPARSFAPALLEWNFQHLWIYIAAPFLGSALAAITFKLTNSEA